MLTKAAQRYGPQRSLSRAALAVGLLGVVALGSPGDAQATVPGPRTIASALDKGAAPAPAQPWVLTLTQVEPIRTTLPGKRPGVDKPRAFQPRWRLRLAASTDGTVQIDREDLTTGTIVTEAFPKSGTKRPPAWLRALLSPKPSKVLQELKLSRRTSLARAGKGIVWVWGAGPRDRKSDQAHVRRADGSLHRLIVAGVDTTYLGSHRSGEAKTRWPLFIEFRSGKDVTRYAVSLVAPASLPSTSVQPPRQASPPSPPAK